VETEILSYQTIGFAFLICLPVALVFVILPARSQLRKRLRWGTVAFIGLGILFVGLAASWPGSNTITLAMMCSGLVAFSAGSFCLTRSFCSGRQ
jgi:hypothetical protein